MEQDNGMNTRGVSRRSLVQMAGVAGVAGLAAPAIVKAAPDQMKFGFIGTGSRGDYLLKHLKSIDNGRCLALSDISQEHLDRYRNSAFFKKSWATLKCWFADKPEAWSTGVVNPLEK